MIEQHYGVDGVHVSRPPHQTGAGHPEDEEDPEGAQITDTITSQQRQYVHHEAVRVPAASGPFASDELRLEEAFYAMFRELVAEDITPYGFGLTPDEWEEGHYPVYETIRVGRRGTKDLHVSLGEVVWYNRACLWVQGLVAMTYILEGHDSDQV